MKLEQVKIKNFRSYREEISTPIADLTALIAKNYVGPNRKSPIHKFRIYTLSFLKPKVINSQPFRYLPKPNLT